MQQPAVAIHKRNWSGMLCNKLLQTYLSAQSLGRKLAPKATPPPPLTPTHAHAHTIPGTGTCMPSLFFFVPKNETQYWVSQSTSNPLLGGNSPLRTHSLHNDPSAFPVSATTSTLPRRQEAALTCAATKETTATYTDPLVLPVYNYSHPAAEARGSCSYLCSHKRNHCNLP